MVLHLTLRHYVSRRALCVTLCKCGFLITCHFDCYIGCLYIAARSNTVWGFAATVGLRPAGCMADDSTTSGLGVMTLRVHVCRWRHLQLFFPLPDYMLRGAGCLAALERLVAGFFASLSLSYACRQHCLYIVKRYGHDVWFDFGCAAS
jgi:hypothetical protein